MPQPLKIGDPCFVVLNGRTFPGVIVEFWRDSMKGDAVRVETEAAGIWRRPWKAFSFWCKDARMVADRNVELIIPRDAQHRAQLEHDVANPPLDERIRWLAAQAQELPLEGRSVPQFPRELDKEKAPTSDSQ